MPGASEGGGGTELTARKQAMTTWQDTVMLRGQAGYRELSAEVLVGNEEDLEIITKAPSEG